MRPSVSLPPTGLPSMRPGVSLPPILFDDVQPKSVYPLLKALAEKVPKADGGIPKAPRMPQVEPVPASSREASSERVPRSGVPKLAVAVPLDLDAKWPVRRTEWMASVPDEDVFDKLFDEVTSRSPDELEAAGIGRGGIENAPDSAKKSRRRLEYADTMQMQAVTSTPEPNSATNESQPLASPPLGPPPAPNTKAVRFGPRPATPEPPKLKRGFAPPPAPVGASKRPSVIMLAGVFAAVAIGVALLVMAFSDKPKRPVRGAASASASAIATASAKSSPSLAITASSAPTLPLTASSESPPPPLPYGQGYLTIVYPGDAVVYISGRKLGQTNTRLQNRCGRYFVRIAKSGEGQYPEWLSAGEPVAIPCQDSIQVTISR
jgi:serine/threonine-protein kinase